ncbi:MAG: DUF4388 domain-containing protein [Sandaracinaceae bacterium]|nr:DUF4388 domain-containing protein [Sandaracinaceae bacterium]
MSEPTDLVLIGADGAVRVAGRGAERRLRGRAGRYRLVADAPGLVVLREDGEGEASSGTRVAMAGELLSRTSVLEVVNIVATLGWRGELHIFDGAAHRTLAVHQGAVKYALSDHPDDRLGQVLYRHGVLSRAELDEILREVGPEKRLGQLLLERSLLTQEQLFGQLQKQIEQIFFAALLTRGGHYVFSVPDDSAEPPVHTVHLPIQALLMEGVQRIDEMALFRERIPSDDLCPVVQASATRLTLDENAQLVLTYADGARTIEEISRESGLGLFMTIKALYGMLQQGGVVLKRPHAIDADAVKQLVRSFNEILRDVFMAVATYGGMDQTRSTLEAWIHGSGYAPIFGDKIEEDGSIRAEVVLDALSRINADNPMEGLQQALHELAAFALFAATTTLPRDQELALSRDVNSRLKRIRM